MARLLPDDDSLAASGWRARMADYADRTRGLHGPAPAADCSEIRYNDTVTTDKTEG